MKYLICELKDENYTEPYFHVCDKKEKSFTESMKRLEYLFQNKDSKIEISHRGDVLRVDWSSKDRFYVIENLPVDESAGDCLLVWHHAYNGVNFKILAQGTYDECVKERIRIIKKIFAEEDLSSGDNEGFDMETDTCIDTGEEWEVFSIINIKKIQL